MYNTSFIIADIVLFLIGYFLTSLAFFKLFEKAGEKKSDAWIPFYRYYIFYKISWTTVMFLPYIISAELVTICNIFTMFFEEGSGMYIILSLLLLFSSLASLVITIMQKIRLSHAFSKRGGFTVGLILLPTIFLLILAYGKSKYIGPQE